MIWKAIQRPSLVVCLRVGDEDAYESPLKRLTKIFSRDIFKYGINDKNVVPFDFTGSYLPPKNDITKFPPHKNINFISTGNEIITDFLIVLMTNEGVIGYKYHNNEILLRFHEMKYALNFYKKNIGTLYFEFLPEYRFKVSEIKDNVIMKNENVGPIIKTEGKSCLKKINSETKIDFENAGDMSIYEILSLQKNDNVYMDKPEYYTDYKKMYFSDPLNSSGFEFINNSKVLSNIYTYPLNDDTEDCPYMRFIKRVYALSRSAKIFTHNEINFFKEKIRSRDYETIFRNIVSLSVGAQTNILIQDLLEELDDITLCRFINGIGRDFIIISCTKYGAYTTQKLLSLDLNKEHKNLILKYVHGDYEQNANLHGDTAWCGSRGIINYDLLCMITDSRGNYTFQKIIPFDKEKFKNILLDNFEVILNSELGFVVIKSCMVHFKGSKSLFRDKFLSINKTYTKNVCEYFKQLNDD